MAHYRESEVCASRNTILTVANAVSSITVLFLAAATWISPLLFGDTGADTTKVTNTYKLLVSISSLLVVLTTILHYLFGYGERASRHAASAKAYSALLKKIERYGCSNVCDMDSLHIISKQYSSVTNAAPLIAKSRWDSQDLDQYSSHIKELESQQQGDLFSDSKPRNVAAKPPVDAVRTN